MLLTTSNPPNLVYVIVLPMAFLLASCAVSWVAYRLLFVVFPSRRSGASQ